MSTRAWKFVPYVLITIVTMTGILIFPESTSTIAAFEIPVPRKNYFANVQVEAKSAYVYDVSARKVLYAKNDAAVLPLASLTKIMTAVTALELAPTSTIIRIEPEHLAQQGDSGLLSEEVWSLENLLKYTLVVSSNDGAAAIASTIGGIDVPPEAFATERNFFIKKMNDNARRLGLSKMWFTNESGLDQDDVVAGGYGSAQDVTRLINYALGRYRPILESTKLPFVTVASEDGFNHTAKNTNTIIDKIPGLIAGKTGYTQLAGGNLAVIFEAKKQRPIIVVVLGSSYDGRFTDVDTLVQTAIAAIKEQ